MANNYFQWSTEICGLTPDERSWWKQALERTDRDLSGVDFDFFAEVKDETADQEDQPSRRLHIYSEESGSLEDTVDLIEAFFKEFRTDAVLAVEWASTCSKMRVGEFGGGAVIIRASGSVWFSTEGWVRQQLKGTEDR